MEWVEVTGKTVDEAKDRALDYLGVDESQAEFEILEEPRISGLFRRLKGEARVRARIKPVRPRAKAERRDRRRGKAGAGRDGESREPREPREGGGRRPDGRREGRGGVSGGDAGERADRPERSPRPDRERGDRGRGGRGPRETAPSRPAEDAAVDVAAPAPPSGPGVETTAKTERPDAAPRRREREADARPERPREGMLQVQDDQDTNDTGSHDDSAGEDHQAEDAKAFVEGLVGAFGLTATVTVAHVDESLDEVQVTGADLGILIGPKAATLEAVQELTRVAVQRRVDGRSDTRLRVDIGSYRQRRREALERFARKLAEEVRTTGVQKVLEPMGSADRKVIHDTVGQLDGVRTLSEGEDPRRRVVIVPAS